MDLVVDKKMQDRSALPAGWDIAPLGALCRSITDGTHFTPTYVTDGVPFYSVENVTNNNFSDTKYISREEHQSLIKRCKPERGDILMTRIGSLGDTKMLNWDVDASIYVSLALLKPTAGIDSGYLYAYTKSHAFVEDVEKRALLNASPKKINMGDIGDIPVPFPTALGEQRAIADAISDADAYVELLAQLLAKKRALMQGAMQELLTAKRRLPGFTGEWKTASLSQIADIRSGGTPSTANALYWDGDIPWCTPTDITALKGRKYISETNEYISKQGLAASSADLIPPRSVLMTSRATIGECAVNLVACTTNQGFKNFVPKAIDGDFLYYLLRTQKAAFISLCGGSTFLEIGKAQLNSFEVRFPRDHGEQRAIAQVLSDMDDDIWQVEHKIAKARNVRQGMIQDLLTGRVRLV